MIELPKITIMDFIMKPKEATEPVSFIKEEVLSSEGWVPIKGSSTIIEARYDRSTPSSLSGTLSVKFKNTNIYEYSPVTEYMWLEFLGSKSKGSYLYLYIKSNKDIVAKKVA